MLETSKHYNMSLNSISLRIAVENKVREIEDRRRERDNIGDYVVHDFVHMLQLIGFKNDLSS